MPPEPTPPKKPIACVRCRHRKVKCDGLLPACSNCLKARVPCEESAGSEKRYIRELEARVRELETQLTSLRSPTDHAVAPSQPDPSPGNASAIQAHTPSTPRIGPEQPLAHEVGLLSLQAANSPKYLGPSSGVAFARLIFASAPHTQGLSTHFAADLPQSHLSDISSASHLPSLPEIHRFVAAYFDQFHHLYPFLDEVYIDDLVEKCLAKPSLATDSDMCMLFLVIAIGSRAVESQLGADFASATYLAAAIKFLSDIPLHESIQGVQILLLLVLSSFCFPGGLNAWFLTHTIIASCLDLGLQRKQPMDGPQARFGGTVAAHDTRSGIFWSAYSLDRTLCTTLGRPLTLRDEAIDIEFPGQQGSDEVDLDAIEGATQVLQPPSAATPVDQGEPHERQPKRMRSEQPPHHNFYTANISFRFDRIVAEVKLMIHRVAQSPKRFPWPSDFEGWQKAVHASCKGLFEHAQQTLSRRAGGIARSISYRSIPSIELKYHQCVMLLYRPSPAFPRPAPEALHVCFDSATETIRIYYELHRFGQMMNSWLTAHSIFVSAITMLYCIWISPAIRGRARDTFSEHARRCSEILEALGKTWSVAKDARAKFDRLAEATSESWRRREEPVAVMESTAGPDQSRPADGSGLGVDWTEQSFDALFDSTDIFADELGDMSGWFDLEWFETYGVEGLGNAGMA
ncbi:hypothetical protein BFW01_g10132 [Lasiodiplodia theobromae]|uniref:Zn(2)-C6 fungal-type domain-containing protein n=1 Tax=Lasiodiplodia theobromae TaxID=45133 RepID=A0A8H7M9V0_9PEZI|nr:hypothetical protein BFW01_g10132 [Lasiodiplodia theobromae]